MSTEINLDILDAPMSIMYQDDLDGDALAHFGIKGQRWGIRRYQNPDGSLTAEGKLRYSDSRKSITQKGKTKGQARFIMDASKTLDATPHTKDDDTAFYDTIKKLGKTAEESGVMDPNDSLSPFRLSSSPDQSRWLNAIYENMPTVQKNKAEYYKNNAEEVKKNASGLRKEKMDWLDDVVNRFHSDLHEELGTKKGRETTKFLIDAVKGFNEGDPDQVTYQHMDDVLDLLRNNYIDQKTFNKLYDAQAAEDAIDWLGYGWSPEEIKTYNGWYKNLNHSDLDQDSLAHFGIKGMRWGIRRYQNPDGSLTDAGRERYSGSKGRQNIAKDSGGNSDSEASILKQIAPQEREKAVSALAGEIKSAKGSDLYADGEYLKEHGYGKNDKDVAEYMLNAAKKCNENYSDECPIFEHMKRELDLYQNGKIDKNTFDALYDAKAAQEVMEYGRDAYDWHGEGAKGAVSANEYKSDLNNRLSYWFADNPSNPEYNPKKPVSVFDDEYGDEELFEWYEQLDHSDPTQDFLAHHGIKGQKWGIRRYQNPDGSLTTMGRMRYGVGAARKATGKAAKAAGKAIGKAARKATGLQTDEELDAELKKAQAKYDRAEKKRQIEKMSGRRKPVYRMSDRELDEYVNRLNKEKQAQAIRKEIKENGRGFISKFAHNTMDNIADNTARGIGEGLKRGLSGKIDEVITGKGESSSKKAANEAQNQLNRYRDDLEYKALNGDIDALRRLATTKAATGKNSEKVLADLEKRAKEAEAKQKQAEENERRKKEILDRYSKARQEYWSSHLLPPSQ